MSANFDPLVSSSASLNITEHSGQERTHNNHKNQQELEQEDWADAREEQGLDESKNRLDRLLKDLQIEGPINDKHASSFNKQPIQICPRACLTDVDPDGLMLHEAVFNNATERIHQILNDKELAQQFVNKKDKHGNTPLHLACMLGRSKEVVEALLQCKASVDCKNLNRWTPFHEALSYGNRDIVTLMAKQLEGDLHDAFNKDKLSEKLEKTKDYTMTLKWEFQSWIPLIVKALPNDLCKITKHGKYIRIDTGLFDYGVDHRGWMSGNSRACSLIYNPDFAKRWVVLNKKGKNYQYINALSIEKKNIEDKVDDCMAFDIMDFELKSTDIQLTRSTSGWIWKADKVEQIGNFEADIYNVNNVCLVTRKRREHLSEEDMKRNKVAYKSAINIFKFGKFSNDDADDDSVADSLYGSNENHQEDAEPAEIEHRESLAPPTPRFVTWQQYLKAEPGKFPLLGREHKSKTSTTAFKASVAMSRQFPIDKNEFLDLLSIIPVKLFKKLQEFIEIRLPEGFPIRLDIPVFPPFLTSRITFEDFKFLEGPIDESLFTIPDDFKEEPNLYPVLSGHKKN